MEFEAPPGANCLLKGNGSNVSDIQAIRTPQGFIVAARPTRAELARLLAGAPIFLSVLGQCFAPVQLEVGDPAEAPSAESLTRDPFP